MTDRKGLLTVQQQKLCGRALDFWFKFNNKILESVDGWLFEKIIQYADDLGADKIPPAWKDELIPIIDAALEERYEDVRVLTVDLLNKKIDIPKLDDYQEMIVFDAFGKFLATAIDFYVQKTKK